MTELTTAPAKLSIPEAHRVLPRGRLFDLIDSHPHSAVWISGPPGAGKTALASSYLAARGVTGAWYKLDEADAEPATFFYFLSKLAGLLQPHGKPAIPPLTPDRMPGLAVYARSAFRALYAQVSTPLLLVFDDFHALPPDAPTGLLLRIAIEELPAGSRMLVLSREPRAAPFAGLELYGRLALLGWPDLQLTEAEARELMRARRADDLEEVVFQALLHQSRGWMTGWILLLRQLERSGAGDIEKAASNPSLQLLFDYFSSELFERESSEQQRFLMETAFLPCLNADTARSLTGTEDAGLLLERLSASHFVSRLPGDGENVFVYHDLYRDFLQHQAGTRLGRHEIEKLRLRVAAVLETHGMAEGAIALYVRLQDWTAVVRLALERIPVLVAQGRTAAVQDWLACLPAGMLDTNPWLEYWWGLSCFPADMERAQSLLEQAYEGFAESGDVNGRLLSAAGIISVLSFNMNNVTPASEWLRRILNLVPEPDRLPGGPAGAYIAAAVFSAYALLGPSHADVPKWRNAAVLLTARAGDPLLRARTLMMTVLNAALNVEPDATERYMTNLWELADTHPDLPAVVLFASHAGAFLHIFHADWNAVLMTAEKGLQLAAESDVHFFDNQLMSHAVNAAMYAGREEPISVYAKRMSATHDMQPPWDRSCTEWTLGRIAYQRGEYESALEQAQRALRLVEPVGVMLPVLSGRMLIIQSLCALKRFDEALERLVETGKLVESHGSQFQLHEHRMLQIYVWSICGRHEEAVAGLKDAWDDWINRGRPGFFDLQIPVIRHVGLLALMHGMDPGSVKYLFDRYGLEPEGDACALETWPWPLKIYTLGRFSLVRDGVEMRFSGKAQKKPLELLKALIAFGAHGVAQERLAEALWPDSDGDAAIRACSTTLYRLRKLLGDERLIVVGDNKVTLEPRFCWVDSQAFEQALSTGGQGSIDELLCAIDLYKGHYMENAAAEHWVLRPRERLRSLFVAAVRDAARALCEQDRHTEACRVAEQGLAIDDLVEDFYVVLMTCHRYLDRHNEAMDAYRRCERRMQHALGVAPSPRTRELRDSIMDELKST